MEEKVLVFDPFLCTGCMRCMTTCSTYNEGATSLSKARLFVARHEGHAVTSIDEEDELIFVVLGCQQCDKPYCMYLCPVKAITKDKKTGAMVINHDRCIGCRMCIVGCPFGAVQYNSNKKQPFKCELCEGDPQCVKFCPTGALQFLPKSMVHIPKLNFIARKTVELQTAAGEEIPVREVKDGSS